MLLHTLPVHQLNKLLQTKETSSQELIRTYLERISQVEGETRAFLTITEEEAILQARAVDEKRARGEELSALAGIPFALGDNLCTAGVRTTCASRMLQDYVPPNDAGVAVRLKQSDAVLIGKGNLDEFGMGSSTENSAFQVTRNPYSAEAIGGAGAAAAVAAGEAAFGLGSDTGGAVRLPATFCGLVGFKPTYGYVSRTGLISHASSLDQVGPYARDLTDLALILNIICGKDEKDSTSASHAAPDFTQSLLRDVKGLKIGLPKEYIGPGTAPQAASKLREAARKLEELGAVCEEMSLPHTEYAAAAHYLISSAEASSNLARYDGVRYGLRVEAEDVLGMFQKTRGQGFGNEVKRRIILGTHLLSTANYETYYLKALKARSLVRKDFDEALQKYDCLLTPIAPTTAFKNGEKTSESPEMYLSEIYTLPANLAGVPALSLPFGTADEGLPVGIQLLGRHFEEETLLRIGCSLEQISRREGSK